VKDSVPRVIAALASNNDINLRGEHVDNLPFTFVAPLRSN